MGGFPELGLLEAVTVPFGLVCVEGRFFDLGVRRFVPPAEVAFFFAIVVPPLSRPTAAHSRRTNYVIGA
jgi:hypothetical protein